MFVVRPSKFLRSASVHQFCSTPARVVFAALIVEAVADFVTDHRADGAVIHRIVRFRIEERRLQNGGRKNDLVPGRVVIGVHGLRRHAPFAAVDRVVQPDKIAIPLEFRTALLIAEQIVAHDLQFGVVAPFIGIADLDREARDLLERLGARLGRHPVSGLDALAIDIEQIARRDLAPWPWRRRGK